MKREKVLTWLITGVIVGGLPATIAISQAVQG